MQEEFVFSGFGGQGVMFAGQLLAYAAMDAGLEVTWIPSYGPEMRGGTAHCFVVISDKPIGSPQVSSPKTAVLFNIPSFDKYEMVVAPGGLLAYNASLVERKTERTDVTVLPVPASDLADEIGNMRLLNVIMLGAVLTMRPAISVDVLRTALEGHIPPHRRDLLPQNFEALEAGVKFASEQAQPLMP